METEIEGDLWRLKISRITSALLITCISSVDLVPAEMAVESSVH